jgi:hypothetical protein
LFRISGERDCKPTNWRTAECRTIVGDPKKRASRLEQGDGKLREGNRFTAPRRE